MKNREYMKPQADLTDVIMQDILLNGSPGELYYEPFE